MAQAPEGKDGRFRILIIKLGELGDVIRTTPILHKLRKDYPDAEITWISNTPEFLPDIVDCKLEFNNKNTLKLQAQEFDLLLNFDKEQESLFRWRKFCKYCG